MTTRGRRRGNGQARKIVVTGPCVFSRRLLVWTISEITVLSTERGITDDTRSTKSDTTVAMDFGRITIDRDLVLYLFGTPGQDRFDFMWEILGEGMLGYVVLVDASRPESLDEAASIVRAFRKMANVPYVVGLNRADGIDEEEERRVRDTLDLMPDVPVVPCDASDRESVKSVLLALLYAVVESLDDTAAVQAT